MDRIDFPNVPGTERTPPIHVVTNHVHDIHSHSDPDPNPLPVPMDTVRHTLIVLTASTARLSM